MSLRKGAHGLAAGIERRVDRRRRVRRARTVAIAPYRGFGRSGELLIRGRVLVEKNITKASAAEPVWRNVLNAWRRFESDEVAGARVRAAYRDAVVETVSDEEGHFQVRLAPMTTIDPSILWHEVSLSLAESDVTATGHVLVPSDRAEFGVISDIDDTIVQTGATSVKTMLRSVMLQNAAMRLPFEGVGELYRALHRNANPIFYVSSSPWNLYDVLEHFKALNGIPPGPMFLQDFGIDEATFIHDAHDVHKLREIQTIFDYYPSLSFVLIGDSGQHDPEIYLRVVQANATRIRAVIIRDVTGDVRDKSVAALADQLKSSGVKMLYVGSSAEALEHVRELGLVH
jgi:phosphatidate phosphatase APP1